MPQATNLDDEWLDDTGKLWKKKVKFINANLKGDAKTTITDLDNFVKLIIIQEEVQTQIVRLIQFLDLRMAEIQI